MHKTSKSKRTVKVSWDLTIECPASLSLTWGKDCGKCRMGDGCHWESYLEWYRSDLKLRRDLAGKNAIEALDYLREGQTDIFLDVPHFSSMKETAMRLYELAINEKSVLRDLLRYISTHLLLEDCGRQSFDWTTALSCILEQTNWTDLVDENTEQFLLLTKEVIYPEFLLF